ncbi:MAG: hypothetical protein ACO21O_05950, partial [Steroidobacteraceae bacterium]
VKIVAVVEVITVRPVQFIEVSGAIVPQVINTPALGCIAIFFRCLVSTITLSRHDGAGGVIPCGSSLTGEGHHRHHHNGADADQCGFLFPV